MDPPIQADTSFILRLCYKPQIVIAANIVLLEQIAKSLRDFIAEALVILSMLCLLCCLLYFDAVLLWWSSHARVRYGGREWGVRYRYRGSSESERE